MVYGTCSACYYYEHLLIICIKNTNTGNDSFKEPHSDIYNGHLLTIPLNSDIYTP